MRILGPAAVASGLVALGVVGLYALTRDPQPSADPASADRLVLPATTQSDPALRNLELFSKNLSSTDKLSDQREQSVQVSTRVKGAAKANSGLPPVDELIERLVARLAKNPKDIEGWRTLGWSYLSLERFDDAAAAYAKAIELSPNAAELHSARGEALVRAANGTVTADSKLAFSEALKLNSKEPRARYFMGIAKVQAGNKAAALDDWVDVFNEIETSDPIIPALEQSIAEMAKELNVDVSQRLHRALGIALKKTPGQPKTPDVGVSTHESDQSDSNKAEASIPAVPATPTRPTTPPAPTAAPVPAAPAAQTAPAAPTVSPALTDQKAMIGEMVDNLSRRLESSPRDVDGWILLIRSRKVLNDPGAARQTFERALKVFDDPSPERDRLLAAAKEFGLNP
jgi:cytochrome c-type biogenesis protein CcmH